MAEPVNEQTVKARDPKGWYVTYMVVGHGEFQAGPYPNQVVAHNNLVDIDGYQGILGAQICPPTSPS